jgi:hypothetical protein
MAEFCRQCAEELDFEPDFTGLFERDGEEPDGGKTGYPALCETCGPQCFIIDNEGTCGSMYCSGSLHDGGTPHGR